jgi:hypothetical protein
VRLPFDRRRLAQRDAVDVATRRVNLSALTPAEGIMETVELSEVVHKLAVATGAAEKPPNDLAEKARLYVRPLRAARGR